MTTPDLHSCTWLVAVVRDDFTRGLLRDGLHQAIHQHAGPLHALVQDVLKDGGLQLVAEIGPPGIPVRSQPFGR